MSSTSLAPAAEGLVTEVVVETGDDVGSLSSGKTKTIQNKHNNQCKIFTGAPS